MKKAHFIILFLFTFNIYSTIGQDIKEVKVSPLLKTNWHQKGLYAKYSPENVLIGCWSTSFAQIFYYHSLFPKGQIDYTLSNNNKIRINIDTVHFNSKFFPEKLNKETSQELVNDVAMYSFCTAAIITKDFGTGGYKEPMSTINVILEKHFDCKVNYYEYMQTEFETKYDSIILLVQNEIDKRHPLLYYVEDSKKEFGHAMVIDGYKFKKNHFYVHLNLGWNGKSNGWYRFDKRIFIQYNDKECRVLLTVKPS
jgi:Peptidase C10 family